MSTFDLELTNQQHRSPSPLLTHHAPTPKNAYTGTVSHEHTDAHPDVDPKMTPLYQSITEAKGAHLSSGRGEGGGASKPPSYNGHTPSESTAIAANEYDIIGERTQQGRVMQAENALYSTKPATTTLTHPTLSYERHRYAGESSLPPEPDSDEVTGCCRCRVMDYWMCGFVLIALIVATAALAFSLALFLGVRGPTTTECSCPNTVVATDTTTGTESPATAPSTATIATTQDDGDGGMDSSSIEAIRQNISDLLNQVQNLQLQLQNGNAVDSMLASDIQSLQSGIAAANKNISVLANAPTDVTGLSFSANFTNLDLRKEECTTVTRECTVTDNSLPIPFPNACATATSNVPLDVPGTYVSSLECEVFGERTNPLVGSLGTENNFVFCTCYQIVLINTSPAAAGCRLKLVRCPLEVNTTATVST